MNIPQAPQDPDLRNTIDKLAQFVARNGPEFERMTKDKQHGNPRFSFLFGGEFYNYYQYKLTTEQAIMRQKQQQQQHQHQQQQHPQQQHQSQNPHIWFNPGGQPPNQQPGQGPPGQGQQFNPNQSLLTQMGLHVSQALPPPAVANPPHNVMTSLHPHQPPMSHFAPDRHPPPSIFTGPQGHVIVSTAHPQAPQFSTQQTQGAPMIPPHLTSHTQIAVSMPQVSLAGAQPFIPGQAQQFQVVQAPVSQATSVFHSTSIPNPQIFSQAGPPQIQPQTQIVQTIPHTQVQALVQPPPQPAAQLAPAVIPPQPPKEMVPDVPYFELPAGLMVPLVKPESCDYEPIDPKDIRLPPPTPPSERLLQAVEQFYAPPSHDKPRDADGWEKLGLYEFYKMKSSAKKDKKTSHNQDSGDKRHSRERSP